MVAKWPLIVVPTPLEKRRLVTSDPRFESAVVVGFGLLESAIAMNEILRSRDKTDLSDPAQAVLVGIAGTYDPAGPEIGSAIEFGSIFCDGIGIGQFGNHQTDHELGWQTDAAAIQPLLLNASGPPLLSVAAASANAAESAWRRRRYPGVVAEDMEAYSIARICQNQAWDLRVIRGISNIVGDRCHDHWQIDQALQSVAKTVCQIFGQQR